MGFFLDARFVRFSGSASSEEVWLVLRRLTAATAALVTLEGAVTASDEPTLSARSPEVVVVKAASAPLSSFRALF